MAIGNEKKDWAWRETEKFSVSGLIIETANNEIDSNRHAA